ncbi:MAG TPA: ABC transporter permease [Bryobacteraceae bacterium]|nr:ABC transporter permease [Bryobacteraceae bacterium]
MLADLLHGVRSLVHTRAFALPAIAALAAGIGATTAVYSVVHTMLFRSMDMKQVERLVAIWQTDPKRGQKHIEVCYNDLLEWTKRTDTYAGVALASSVNLDFPLLGDAEPVQVDGTTVTGNFFELLGARPAAGRLLTPADDKPGGPLHIVISHRLWTSRYGGDPKITGRQIRAGDDTATIVGVARPEFDFPRDVDIWAPLRAAWPDVEKQARLRVFRAVARLQPDVTPQRAQAATEVVNRHIERTLPAGAGSYNALVVPLLEEIFGAARTAVWLFFGAVTLVLLIACVNAGNLMLARAAVRERELAIRAALGGSRWRLVRLLLSEALVIAAVAGALGMVLAMAGIEAITRLAPPDIPRISESSMDRPVFLFGLFLSLATVLLFGMLPAWMASGRDVHQTMQSSARGTADRSHTRARNVLMGAEIAIALVLLTGSGLLIRSFQAMASVDPGFDPRGLATFRITMATGSQEKRREMYSQVLDRVRGLPGVQSAAAVLIRPLSGIVGWDTSYAVEHQDSNAQKSNPNANYEAVSPDYFRTMSIRVLEGRDFTARDTHTAPGVVIINQSTARRHWPSQSAIGKRLRTGPGPDAPWLTVVGIVNDVRYREWEAARADIYVPFMQRAQHRSDFVVKANGDAAALIPAIRRTVLDIDKNQPVSNVTTMEALVDRALSRSRFNGTVMSVLAACALALAVIGIYGVLSYTITTRTAEIGIRMAVGATPRKITGMVMVEMGLVAIVGSLAGLVGSLAASRGAASLLYQIRPTDPLVYIGSSLALVVAVILACIVPALRAATVDPIHALRSE